MGSWFSFGQRVDPIWIEPFSTGSAGALARSPFNLKPLDAETVSRFALMAGEGARAPSFSLSLSAHATFWARLPQIGTDEHGLEIKTLSVSICENLWQELV